MDAAPSYTGEPVSCSRTSPRAARASPIRAAVSSNSAALTVVSRLVFTCSSNSVCDSRASPRNWLVAR